MFEAVSSLGSSINLSDSWYVIPLVFEAASCVMRDSWASNVNGPPIQHPATKPATPPVELETRGRLVDGEADAPLFRSCASFLFKKTLNFNI